MTDAKQPAQFDWATELSDAQGHVTLSEQEAHEIGARLRTGYEAARLEIESLHGQLHAAKQINAAQFGLLAAAPTTQPAPQQEVQERVYLVATGETLNGRELYERHEKYVPLADCETLYTAPQPAPQQEPSHTAVRLAELVLSDCGHSSNYTPLLDRVAARIDAHVERRLDELRGCLESNPAPSPAAQGDAARLDFLIEHQAYVVSDDTCCDGYWLRYPVDGGTTSVQIGEYETPREAIDAARAAQEGR